MQRFFGSGGYLGDYQGLYLAQQNTETVFGQHFEAYVSFKILS